MSVVNWLQYRVSAHVRTSFGPTFRSWSGCVRTSSRPLVVADDASLVAVGRTNRQIAAQLHITENTVATHLKRIFNLGVRSRAAAATAVSRSG